MQVCKVLGQAILWRAFSLTGDDCFSDSIHFKLLDGIHELGSAYTVLKDGTSPVKKVPLVVSGLDFGLGGDY